MLNYTNPVICGFGSTFQRLLQLHTNPISGPKPLHYLFSYFKFIVSYQGLHCPTTQTHKMTLLYILHTLYTEQNIYNQVNIHCNMHTQDICSTIREWLRTYFKYLFRVSWSCGTGKFGNAFWSSWRNLVVVTMAALPPRIILPQRSPWQKGKCIL